MVVDGYNLSFPQLGVISNSGHGEDWSLGRRADKIDDVGVLVLQEARQVQTKRFRETQKEENGQICEVRVPARVAPGHDVQQICHVER